MDVEDPPQMWVSHHLAWSPDLKKKAKASSSSALIPLYLLTMDALTSYLKLLLLAMTFFL